MGFWTRSRAESFSPMSRKSENSTRISSPLSITLSSTITTIRFSLQTSSKSSSSSESTSNTSIISPLPANSSNHSKRLMQILLSFSLKSVGLKNIGFWGFRTTSSNQYKGSLNMYYCWRRSRKIQKTIILTISTSARHSRNSNKLILTTMKNCSSLPITTNLSRSVRHSNFLMESSLRLLSLFWRKLCRFMCLSIIQLFRTVWCTCSTTVWL